MKRIAFLAFLLLPSLLRAQDDTATQAALDAETARIPVVREALKKTVLVGATARESTVPVGSGALVSADGLIVTCAHVVEGARSVLGNDLCVILFDGTTHAAKVLGLNSANDIALLKIEGEKFPHFDLGDCRPAKDERVIALGFPMGNIGDPWKNKGQATHPSVALGKVTDPNRKFAVQADGGAKYYPDCIESDTPIFMGNSGGPLVNLKGELVGLNAAIAFSGKSYTLSSGSICRCIETLKEGRDAEGEKADQMSPEDYGKILWDAFGGGAAEGERTWLLDDFAPVAKARRAGVIPLVRGKKTVGYATAVDGQGNLVASIRVVDKKGFWAKLADEVEKGVEDEGWRDFLKGAREFLGIDEEPLQAMLPSGRCVSVDVGAKSKKFGLVLLRIEPGDEKLEPVPSGDLAKLEPGAWVAVIGASDRPLAVGLLSVRKHTINAAKRFPLSISDWIESWKDGDLDEKEYVDVILFDARLSVEELGTPLCDSKGKMVGITIFHPSRGTSYAAPLADVKKELGLDK